MNGLPWKYIVVSVFFLFVLLFGFFALNHDRVNYDKSLQLSYSKYTYQSQKYEIAIIADMDLESRLSNDSIGSFKSSLILGELVRVPGSRNYTVDWQKPKQLLGEYNEGGRGLELSELIHFDGKLLTCDDRTGIIYEVNIGKLELFPRFIVPTGNGNKTKGFKCEWMAVKDQELYVGSTGKEWTNKQGKLISYDTQWIKIIDRHGEQRAIDWREQYNALPDKIGIRGHADGYIVHEAVNWNPYSNEWAFLPRRVSHEPYDADTESNKGSNHLFTANDDFSNVNFALVGDKHIEQGFSSFKFLPHRPNEVIALKTVELADRIETYVTVIDIVANEYLMKETRIESNKYEGIEFI
jgi:soluble calcium-activated nucleotidase 1